MPKKVKSFRLQPETEKAIEVMAAKEKRSEAQIIDFAIEEYFTKHFPAETTPKLITVASYEIVEEHNLKVDRNSPTNSAVSVIITAQCGDKSVVFNALSLCLYREQTREWCQDQALEIYREHTGSVDARRVQ